MPAIPTAHEIAKEIERIDGDKTMGALQLGQALHDFLAKREKETFVDRLLAGKVKLHSPLQCWCAACDMKANHGFSTRMSLCPECGDKRCLRSKSHDNACSKA